MKLNTLGKEMYDLFQSMTSILFWFQQLVIAIGTADLGLLFIIAALPNDIWAPLTAWCLWFTSEKHQRPYYNSNETVGQFSQLFS